MTSTENVERFSVASEPAVRGFLHRPASENGDGLVLSHGAGSNANAPLLVALAEVFAARGMTVLRCDLPYRQKRPYGPPGPGDAALDRAGLKNAVEALRSLVTCITGPIARRLFLGGHSYGGRQATMLCAEEHGLVARLLLMSYPLHPPRKPEQRRVQHLPKLETDALFVHGTRDPFGSISELEEALRLVPARTKLVVVEGAGHDLSGKKTGETGHIARKIADEFWQFYGESAG